MDPYDTRDNTPDLPVNTSTAPSTPYDEVAFFVAPINADIYAGTPDYSPHPAVKAVHGSNIVRDSPLVQTQMRV